MVEGINTTDNKKTTFNDFKRNQVVNNYPPLTKPMPQDQVVISLPNRINSAKSMNTLQTVASITGIVASSALAFVLLKGSLPVGKVNKQILKRINDANLPKLARDRALAAFNSLRTGDGDIALSIINNLLKLDWTRPVPKIINIEKAKAILDKELIGLEKPKDEIITYLEVQNHKIKNNIIDDSPLILCLDGPPGVGKTSIAEAIAQAMDKKFARISLAGVSHESFVKGVESVYKGAEPGQIIKAMQKSGTSDPVILLDEIDKMGSSREHGDPGAALLDALESKQCKNFTDKNLEVPYDLSNVTFVITSNDLNRIPETLRNRVKVVHIGEYSKETKKAICNLNIQKMSESLKIDGSMAEFTSRGIDEIVNQAKDKGARKTIENLKSVFSYIIRSLRTSNSNQKIIVDEKLVKEALKNVQEVPASTNPNSATENIEYVLRKIFN